MSKKPDGTAGQKAKKVTVYKTKSEKPRKRHEALVAKLKDQGGKTMHVARGTERAARREGLHQGWRIHGRGPKMQPAKVAVVDLVALSSHGITYSAETMRSMAAAKKYVTKMAALQRK